MRMILLVLALAPGTAFMAHAPRRFAVQAPRVSPFASDFSPDELKTIKAKESPAHVYTPGWKRFRVRRPRVLPPMRPYAWLGAGATLQLAVPAQARQEQTKRITLIATPCMLFGNALGFHLLFEHLH